MGTCWRRARTSTDDGRAVRQVDGAVPRQGRVDACGRPVDRHPRRQRHRRRGHAARRRRRALEQAPKQGRVAVSFFGEGAVNQGSFHESLNLAAIWDLPVLFLCENNVYAEFTDSRTMTRVPSVVERCRAYGVDAEFVDGNDVEAVFAVASSAVRRCREGDGPVLIEAETYRWHGHYEGDAQPYKPEDEAAGWTDRDPLGVADREHRRRRARDRGAPANAARRGPSRRRGGRRSRPRRRSPRARGGLRACPSRLSRSATWTPSTPASPTRWRPTTASS